MRRYGIIATLSLSALVHEALAQAPGSSDWGYYGGDAFGQHFSTLDQINRDNVARLAPAWTYRTGELGAGFASAGRLTFEATPVLAFGLRGHLYASGNAGESWQPVETGTVAMLTGAAPFDSGAVAIVGLSGVVLVSRDGGHSFALLQQANRAGLSAVLPASDDKLAVVGEDGARLIGLGAAPPAAGSATP